MSCIMGAYTSAGKVKPVNQDAYCFMEAETSVGDVVMAVVCDGVGGLSNGELASTTVVQRFADWFETMLPKFLSFNVDEGKVDMDALRNVWDMMLRQANAHIYEYGKRNDTVLGTTFTGMILIGETYLVGHVGDCRIYEITDAACKRITKDQTLVAQQVAAGLITEEEAATHPKRNVILQSVGTQEGVEPDFTTGAFSDEATYVLCCDGFYSRASDEELRSTFAPSFALDEVMLVATCEALAQTDMDRGEKDNISAVAFHRGRARAAGEDSQGGEGTGGAKGAKAAKAAKGTTSYAVSEIDLDDSPTIVVNEGDA